MYDFLVVTPMSYTGTLKKIGSTRRTRLFLIKGGLVDYPLRWTSLWGRLGSGTFILIRCYWLQLTRKQVPMCFKSVITYVVLSKLECCWDSQTTIIIEVKYTPLCLRTCVSVIMMVNLNKLLFLINIKM